MADSDQLLDVMQADMVAILQSTPALENAYIFTGSEKDFVTRLKKTFSTRTHSDAGKRGLAIQVLPIFVSEAESNLPGPPLKLRCQILAIENLRINRDADTGTLMTTSQAALNILGSLHHQSVGSHAFYAEKNPIVAEKAEDGFEAHIVTVYARASGLQGPGKAAAVEAAVVDAVPMMLAGNLTPALTGQMLPVASPEANAYGTAGPEWSSDGTLTPAGSGTWGKVFKYVLISPAAATLAEIAPVAGYIATGGMDTASNLSVWNGSSWTTYWLYDENDSNPATAHWVDGPLATDRGGVTIPQGTMITVVSRVPGVLNAHFIGGLGATWQAATNAVFRWYFQGYNNGSSIGYWTLDAASPYAGTWVKQSGSGSGLPAFTAATEATLSLTCATSGSAIYYTTDGSYPAEANDEATLYAAPITLPAAGTMVRAAAYADALNPGDCAEILITD